MARLAGLLAMCATLCSCGLVIDFGDDSTRSADAGEADAMASGRDAAGASDAAAVRDARAPDAEAPPDAGEPALDGGMHVGDASTAPVDAGAPCGLYDPFDDGVPGAVWTVYEDPLVPIRETGGVLEIRPAAGRSAPAYSGYETSEPLNLVNGWVEVRAAGITNAGSWSEMFFQISDGSWLMLFGYSFGRMVCRTERTDHTMRDMSTPGYDATRDVYWRVRHDGGDLVCETSADRTTWIERGRKPNNLDLAAVWFSPYAGTWRTEADPGIARYDDARAWSPAMCP